MVKTGINRKTALRLGLFLGAIAVAACGIAACGSYNEPWCSVTSVTGSTQCLYRSQEQCMASVSGMGGYCVTNPRMGGRRSDARSSSQ